jgi:hypothetical protein
MRLLVGGLTIVIIVLGFNFWVQLARSSESTRELLHLKAALHAEASKNADIAAKLKLCDADLLASKLLVKNLVDDRKNVDAILADLTQQVAAKRKAENAAKDEVSVLNRRLEVMETEKQKATKDVQLSKKNCEVTLKLKTEECQYECKKKMNEIEKAADEFCHHRLREQTKKPNL